MERVSRQTSQQVSAGEDTLDPARVFDLARVNAALAGTIFHDRLQHFAKTDSTQTLALAAAQAGAEAGQVYLADEQTVGRGRGGHTWYSEPGSGLYLTALVRPALNANAVLHLSLSAGLAAQLAIRDTNTTEVDLRWPNDLVTRGLPSRKLGGILTESALSPDGTLRYAAIGIGINLNQTSMPPELQAVSTSLLLETGATTPQEDLAAALLLRLHDELKQLEHSPSQVLARFEKSSTWVRGKHVHVAEDEGYTGLTDGLNEAGLLRVRCDDGAIRVVRHGGVREAS